LSNELIVCVIDGVEIFCEEGWTILDAANSVGIYIPTLCYFKDITTIGSCRVCSVEIVGDKLLHTACSTPVRNGMNVLTNSERVTNARKLIIEMILSRHFGDCLVCDASGECLLEKYSYDFGVSGNLFVKNEFKENIHGIDDKNPLIIHDRGKCILCGICVKVCAEWTHRDALSFVNKGSKIMVSTLYNQGLEKNKECTYCGNCITSCPVGALGEKNAVGRGRAPEVQKVRTICPYCGVGCGIVVYQKANKIVKVRGDLKSNVSGGRLCIKGKFGLDFVNSKERLTKPLIRDENGNFKEVEFIDAILAVKHKIEEIQRKKGGFAGLSSARCTNEDNYVFQKFFRTIIKSDNIDHCARICHSPTVSGLTQTLGSAAMTNPIEDIERVDCFFIIGSNMTSSHPVLSWKIISRVKQGAILILVDPRKSPLSKYATLHLQLNPGSDVSLLNAMCKIIYEERMYDFDMLENRTENYKDFFKSLEEADLDKLAADSGIDESDIRLAARLYAISGASSIYYAMGITQHSFGTSNVISLTNLAIMCGKVGFGPMGVNPLRGQNNVQGACDMGALPGVLPGYKNIENPADRKFFEDLWQTTLPEKKGKTLIEIMNAILDGEINFLYIMGENPVISDPNSNKTLSALEKVDFLVVQDIFLTETAALADIVIPATSFAEVDGTFTNTERRVQKVNKVIEPISKGLVDDWGIINKIAELFGIDWGYKGWKDIFNEIKRAVGVYSHIDPDLLESKQYFWPGDEYGQSVKRLHQNEFSRGKAILSYQEPNIPYKITPEYPYLLIIGRLYEHYHTGTMTRKSSGIESLKPYTQVYINPKDSMKLKLKNDDWVKITSANGEIKARVLISLEVKPSNLFISFHYKEAIANKLTDSSNLDALSKMAPLKVTPVNLEAL